MTKKIFDGTSRHYTSVHKKEHDEKHIYGIQKVSDTQESLQRKRLHKRLPSLLFMTVWVKLFT